MWNRANIALAVSLSFVIVTLTGCGPGPQPPKAETPRGARRPSVPGMHGLVTSGHPLASMAGMQILLKGGNAVDASVAVLATLNVVRPQMSGAGGNGFMTIYEKSTARVYSLNATGAAPKALNAAEVTDEELRKGIKAGVAPGLFGGWVASLDRFGTMSLGELLQPAIDYAENGHPIEKSVVGSIAGHQELFEKFASSRAAFFPQGRMPVANERVTKPGLASTFTKVVEAEQAALKQGKSRSEALRAAFDRFYKGDIAAEVIRFYKEHGGLFGAEDLAGYEPIWAEPVHTTYRGYDVYSSPSTSRGGFEVTMQLNLIEGFDLKKLGHNSPEVLHLVVESIKVAKADVYRYVADPKTTDLPVAGMLSKQYAAERRKLIDAAKAMAYPEPGDAGGERAGKTDARLASHRPTRFSERIDPEGHTDSFSIVDKHGNAVACTPTHGSAFGTGVVVGSTGLTFNNGTRIGSTAPYPDHVNYARGGQIPILNNSPIIVLKNGRFVLAIGTPGGETIGQTQFQAVINVLDFGMEIQEAIAAPRLALVADPSFYKPGSPITVRVENRISEGVTNKLKNMGHKVERIDGYALGSMQGILHDLEKGTMAAGADPRRVAYAVGW